MKVIKDRKVIEDAWSLLPDDGDLPSSGDIIVGLKTWNERASELVGRSGKVGLVLRSHEGPEEIQRLEQLPLIAIDFPKFTDGRGYTSARLLRDRFGYKGELRAIGDVLRDQLFYMARCGIDSFALKPGKNIDDAVQALDDFSVTYQAAADDPRPLFRRIAR